MRSRRRHREHDPRLAKLAEIVEHHLDRIRSVYTDPARMRLTLLIRDPGTPDGARDDEVPRG